MKNLEDPVYFSFIQKRSQRELIFDPLLCDKVLEINKKIGSPKDFKASTDWLKRKRERKKKKFC